MVIDSYFQRLLPQENVSSQPYLIRSFCFQFRIAKSTPKDVRAVNYREVVKLTHRSRKVGWRSRWQVAFHKSRFWVIRCAHRGLDGIFSTYQNWGKPRLVSSSPINSLLSLKHHPHSSLASAPSWTLRSSSYSVYSTLDSFAFSHHCFVSAIGMRSRYLHGNCLWINCRDFAKQTFKC